MLSSFAVNCFAATVTNGEKYTFIYQDGTSVNYYLDENNMPYNVEDGVRMYIALPLEHLKMQSSEADASDELSTRIGIEDGIELDRDPPENPIDLRGGDENKSNIYSAYASFTNYTAFYSRDLQFNMKHKALRIRTTNIEKPLFGSNKISFVYRYYDYTYKQWYRITINDVLCTGVSGYGFQHSPSVFPYGQLVVLIPDDITSCTINVWTTYAY